MNAFFNIMREKMSEIYFIIIVVVLTLYMRDGYYDTLEAKGTMLFLTSLFYVVVMLILSIWTVATKPETVEKKEHRCRNMQNLLFFALVAFAVIALVSAMCSQYRLPALLGSDGCRIGAVHIVLLCFACIFLGCNMTWKDWHSMVFFLGITDCFDWDLFHWKENMASSPYDFLSTIGNRDWYVGYIALVLPFVAILFLYEKEMVKSILYALYLLLGFINIYITKGDGNLLIFGCAIPIMYCALCNKEQWKRLIYLLWLFVLASIIVAFFCTKVDPLHVTGVSMLATLQNYHWYVPLAAVTLLLQVTGNDIMKMQLAKKWLLFSTIVIAIMAVWLVVTFSENFGSNRGYIWTYAGTAFAQSNVWQKWFGWGPDCFKMAIYKHAGETILATWPENNQIANAHNEVLQYLITMGVLGMVAFLAVFVCAFINVWKMHKNCEQKSLQTVSSMAAGTAVFAYFCTALGNNPQPLNYGILFVLLSFAWKKKKQG